MNMKKFGGLFLAVVLTLLVGGCYSSKINMTIKNDKSVDFKYDVEMDFQAMADLFNNVQANDPSFGSGTGPITAADIEKSFKDQMSEDNFKELKDKGFNVTTNAQGSKFKISISKKYKNIDDISSESAIQVDLGQLLSTYGQFDDSQLFQVTTKDGKNVYKADFKLALMEDYMDGTTSAEFNGMEDLMDATYTVTLPQASISNNATSISEDGKTLTWKLDEKHSAINYEFSLDGTVNWLMYIGIGSAALLVIVILLSLASKNGHRNNGYRYSGPQPNNYQPQNPVNPNMYNYPQQGQNNPNMNYPQQGTNNQQF